MRGSSDRPVFFYLFRTDVDFEIVEMTDLEANKVWEKGRRWLDIPRRSLAEAEELKAQYRAGKV